VAGFFPAWISWGLRRKLQFQASKLPPLLSFGAASQRSSKGETKATLERFLAVEFSWQIGAAEGNWTASGSGVSLILNR